MKIRKKFLLTCSILLVAIAAASAQQKEIVGKITDDFGDSLPGVSIMVKGTTTGTTTDNNGAYKIKCLPASTLVFSYIGMEKTEEKVGNRSVINMKMRSSSVELNEVVAIGYGTQSRKDLTGSISSLQSADIAQIPVPNIGQALAGKIAGVMVNQTSGSPDADISIRVRGGISITQSNEPLYIIDGFPTEDGMRGIDPSDIASIDVLKDASSTSIYGARGANGVIVITTKGGKEGKSNISFESYFGYKKITKKLPLLNSQEYITLEFERARRDGPIEVDKLVPLFGNFEDIATNYGNRPGIDWQDQTFNSNNAFSQMYKVSLNGGTKTTQYNVSYSYNNDDGILKGSGLIRNSIRLKLAQQVLKNVKMNVNLTYTDETTTGMGSLNDTGNFSRMQHIVQYRPINTLDRPDSELLLGQDVVLQDESGNVMISPLISIDNEERSNRNRYLIMNGDIQWKILPTLSYRGSIGMRNRDGRLEEFYQSKSRQALRAGAPYGAIAVRGYETFSYGNTLTYNPKLARGHRLDVMVGQEYLYNYENYLLSGARAFPKDNFGVNDMGLGATPDNVVSNVQDNYLLSFFGRANYQLYDKYLFSVSMRADGSSKFGANNKWGYFPAASVAWRASEENFIKNLEVFSNLKVRLSYGTSGNNRIGNYASLALFGSGSTPIDGNQNTNTGYSIQLPNPALKWESNITTNLGFDLGFFDQKLQVTLDIYRNTTKDLLLRSNMPSLSGYTYMYQNVGKTQNSGIELAITSYNIKNKNFSWTTNFNISTNQNKILQLNNGVQSFGWSSGWVSKADFNEDDYRIAVGEAMGQMWGYKNAGIYTVDDFELNADGTFKMTGTGKNMKYTPKKGVIYDKSTVPEPGSWKFADVDGNEEITPDDKTVIGNAIPNFYGGLNNTFTYKGFDLSIFLNFSVGGDIYNANKMYYTNTKYKYRNSMGITRDRFMTINDKGENIMDNPAQLAAVNQNAKMASVVGSGKLLFHSWYVEDASFLRINNISLGYTFPKSWLSKLQIKTLRIYATAYNLYNFTKYSGFDPEVNSRPNGNMTPGIDWGAYPRALSFVGGINLTF